MQKTSSLKLVLSLSIATVILFAQTIAVTAINDQGLVWGIKAGDRFDYNVEVNYHNTTNSLAFNDKMYVIINELNTIADHVTDLGHLAIFSLSLSSYTTYWSNGSIMDDLWFSELNMGSPFIAYPIGNWTLMTQLFEDASMYVEVHQDGTTLNYTWADFPNENNVITVVFLKSNGVPLSHLYNVTWGTETTVFFNLTLIQPAVGPIDYTLILILGGVTAVVILAVVVVIMRRK